METLKMRLERQAFWRGQVANCTSAESALNVLRREAGLDKGRAILFLRKHRPELYNEFRREQQRQGMMGGRESRPGGSLRHNFRFVGV